MSELGNASDAISSPSEVSLTIPTPLHHHLSVTSDGFVRLYSRTLTQFSNLPVGVSVLGETQMGNVGSVVSRRSFQLSGPSWQALPVVAAIHRIFTTIRRHSLPDRCFRSHRDADITLRSTASDKGVRHGLGSLLTVLRSLSFRASAGFYEESIESI